MPFRMSLRLLHGSKGNKYLATFEIFDTANDEAEELAAEGFCGQNPILSPLKDKATFALTLDRVHEAIGLLAEKGIWAAPAWETPKPEPEPESEDKIAIGTKVATPRGIKGVVLQRVYCAGTWFYTVLEDPLKGTTNVYLQHEIVVEPDKDPVAPLHKLPIGTRVTLLLPRLFGLKGTVTHRNYVNGMWQYTVRHDDDGTIGTYTRGLLVPECLGTDKPETTSATETPKPVEDPILLHGTRVITLAVDNPATDWSNPASRRFGVKGTVTKEYRGHGLCYAVKHDDGTEAGYEPRELHVI